MSITKTKNNTYRVRKKYPIDIMQSLGLSNPDYDKIFKTRKEAKQAELEFENRIIKFRNNNSISSFELGGEALFKDFYKDVWLDDYKSGLTSSYTQPPSIVTIQNTEDLFRLHILPMFGAYSLNYLNQHRQAELNIKQTRDQFLFTYCDRQGNLNQRLHTDYLNYRMKSIHRRHPNLKSCSPHKLRHTTATLAKLHGMSLEKISEALTHSNIGTTRVYVNANNVVDLTPANFTYDNLNKNSRGDSVGTLVGTLVGISTKKDTHKNVDAL